MKFDRSFRLSETAGSGVHCSEQGLFVGQTPLLERARAENGRDEWRPRRAREIQHDLGKTYGVPVDLTAKRARIASVARALNNNAKAQAQVSALLLQFPDPPAAPSVKFDSAKIVDFAKQLQASDLLSRDWDPDKHPRWPAHSPDGTGGQFAPAGSASAARPEAATAQGDVPERAPTATSRNSDSPDRVAWDDKMQACHEQCVHLTLQPEGITVYRRCMRECLGGADANY